MQLKDINTLNYNVEIDIKYATKDNFTGDFVYKKNAKCYLHPDAEVALVKAIEIAAVLGYRFRIFDGFRPTEAQWKLWKHTPDPSFLADPHKGSPHSRGVAIDLTLLDKDGREVDMGTAFDEFTPKSHHGNLEVSAEAQRNRIIFMGIMTTAGWDFYRNEWWHYQLFNSRSYPLFSDAESGAYMMEQSHV